MAKRYWLTIYHSVSDPARLAQSAQAAARALQGAVEREVPILEGVG